MISTTNGFQVKFNEEKHQYKIGNKKIKSVSAFKSQFEPKFDADYWALKTAEKRGLYNLVGEFDKETILEEWEFKRLDSLARGNKIHGILEDYFKNNSFKTHDLNFILKVCDHIPAVKLKNDIQILSEQILYSQKMNICGTADLIIMKDRKVLIYDFKTNEKIRREAFRDERLKGSLAFVSNCDYYKYKLQLSLYALMLRHNNFNVLGIAVIHIDHNDEIELIKYELDWVDLLDQLDIYT